MRIANRMQRRAGWMVWAGVAALLVTVGACQSTQTPGTQLSDAAITTKVKAKLTADPEVNPFEIDVDTDNGVVRLSGAVDNEKARSEAVELAGNTDGVRDVVNDITIGEPTFKENVDDAWIVTKIKAKLTAAADIDPFNIDVDANQGVVTLTGKVRTEYAHDHAAELARDTKGVKKVDNRIEVVGRNG